MKNEQLKPTGRPKPKYGTVDIKQLNHKAAVAFGQAVRQTRLSFGISQEDLAYISEIGRGYMGRIERGEVNPSLGIILRISLALKIDSAVLMATMDGLLEIEKRE